MHKTTKQKGTAHRTGKWIVGVALAAAPLLMHVQADAHVVSGAGSGWCSPHNQNESKKGSQFSSCFQWTSSAFCRDFYCEQGSPCANDICGGYRACGFSCSYGNTSHGGKGGHAPDIDWGSVGCHKSCL